jgi:hypothetical protein
MLLTFGNVRFHPRGDICSDTREVRVGAMSGNRSHLNLAFFAWVVLGKQTCSTKGNSLRRRAPL